MSKFIALTNLGAAGEPVMVNLDMIERVERSMQGNAVLFYPGDRRLTVAESLAEFTKKVAE